MEYSVRFQFSGKPNFSCVMKPVTLRVEGKFIAQFISNNMGITDEDTVSCVSKEAKVIGTHETKFLCANKFVWLKKGVNFKN